MNKINDSAKNDKKMKNGKQLNKNNHQQRTTEQKSFEFILEKFIIRFFFFAIF